VSTQYPTEQEEFSWEIERFQDEIKRLHKINQELEREVQTLKANKAEEKSKLRE